MTDSNKPPWQVMYEVVIEFTTDAEVVTEFTTDVEEIELGDGFGEADRAEAEG